MLFRSDLKIKKTIKNFTKPENILKKEGKKIWNIINYISQDIEEKCQKYPNNDLYFSKYTTNIRHWDQKSHAHNLHEGYVDKMTDYQHPIPISSPPE